MIRAVLPTIGAASNISWNPAIQDLIRLLVVDDAFGVGIE
jgi:hypothetical protein